MRSLLFAAYVICKKNYSFSGVVFFFFQSKIANSFYSKIKDSSGVRTIWFWSGRSRVRVLIVPKIFTISNRDPPSTPLIHKIFRFQEFSETPKGYPTNFSGIVRQKISDGKLWYTPLVHKIFRCPKLSETQKGSSTKWFGTVRQKFFQRKIVIPFCIKYRNFNKGRKRCNLGVQVLMKPVLKVSK